MEVGILDGFFVSLQTSQVGLDGALREGKPSRPVSTLVTIPESKVSGPKPLKMARSGSPSIDKRRGSSPGDDALRFGSITNESPTGRLREAF